MKKYLKNKEENTRNLPTASAQYTFGYFAASLDIGADRDELLDILQCEIDPLNNPVRRFFCDDILDMLEHAMQTTGIPSIGLLAGRTFRPETFQNLGYAYISSNSLTHIMDLSRKYQRLTQEFGAIDYEIRGDLVYVFWTPNFEDAERLRPVTEAVFTAYVSISRWLLWQFGEQVISMGFRHKKPKGIDYCSEFFGCEVNYGQQQDYFTASADLFKVRLPQANPQLLQSLEVRLDRALEHLDQDHLLENQVRQTIEHFLDSRQVNLAIIAETLNLSPQALARHLQKEGTTFRQILQEVRQQNVEFYLQEGKKSLTEIAMALGYGDQTAFTRAYKGWYGEVPSLRKAVNKKQSRRARSATSKR